MIVGAKSRAVALGLVLMVAALGLGGCSNPETTQEPLAKGREVATIATARGEIVVELDEEAAPKTVENFVRKSEEGFYDGGVFHRVEDWVAQGGDPEGSGFGGGEQPTELSEGVFKEGAVGAARGGDIEVSNDSQFFICTKDCSWLTGQYTYFGRVVSGMEAAKALRVGDEIRSIRVERDQA